ncbi:hypothetical protein L6452_35952 [Arctium lappa]|uniref:Uncharacterized protein n=1 Tax=Arctium lappa TaxID=4217 RepID=A0ACB8Y7W7_ARCLA|nr:hypothetical protein L6452_35952 [Arctium lappa]
MEQDGVGALRTRSRVAPDWTVEESLILVNEVEADCLASFQKWKIIVENCNALGVGSNIRFKKAKVEDNISETQHRRHAKAKEAHQ